MKEEKKNNTLVTFCGIVLGVYYVFIAFVSKYIANPITQKLLLLIGSIIIGAALGLMITYVQVKFVKEVTKEYIRTCFCNSIFTYIRMRASGIFCD